MRDTPYPDSDVGSGLRTSMAATLRGRQRGD